MRSSFAMKASRGLATQAASASGGKVSGFPACDSVELIQVVQITGKYRLGDPRILTETEQGMPSGDSLDAWTTAANWHIDIAPQIHSPYLTIGYPYKRSKARRTGAVLDTARGLDFPYRDDLAYPDSV